MNKKYKVPVILYESDEQTMPYIEVEKDDTMPPALFIQQYKKTGEVEPDERGNEQAIVDIYVHMYVDMEVLSKKLSPEHYDEVRVALGLKPLSEARKEGEKIMERVNQNVSSIVEDKLLNKDKTKEEALSKLTEGLASKFFKAETAEQNYVATFEVIKDEN